MLNRSRFIRFLKVFSIFAGVFGIAASTANSSPEAALKAAASQEPEEVLFSFLDIGEIPEALKPKAAEILAYASEKALESKDNFLALQLCQMSLKKEASNRQGLLICIMTSRILEQFDIAEPMAADLCRHHPDDNAGFILAAKIAFDQRNWSGASSLAEDALERNGLEICEKEKLHRIRRDADIQLRESARNLAELEEMQSKLDQAAKSATRPAHIAEMERQSAISGMEQREKKQRTERAAEQAVRSIASRHEVRVVVPEESGSYGRVHLSVPAPEVMKVLGPVIEEELAIYPSGYLRALGLRRVYLAASIRTGRGAAAGVGGRGFIALAVSGTSSFQKQSVAQTLHHEIFHVAQSRLPVQQALTNWNRNNPHDFNYTGRRQHNFFQAGPGEVSCFVSSYATTSAIEDQAEVFAHLMMNFQALERGASQNPCLAGKLRMIKEAAASLDMRMNDRIYSSLSNDRFR